MSCSPPLSPPSPISGCSKGTFHSPNNNEILIKHAAYQSKGNEEACRERCGTGSVLRDGCVSEASRDDVEARTASTGS